MQHLAGPRWIFPQHAVQIPSMERFLLFGPLRYFLYKKTTLFLNRILMRTCCCIPSQRQGHTGGLIASSEWEMPAGSSAAARWPGLSCGLGCGQHNAAPKITLYEQHKQHMCCWTAQVHWCGSLSSPRRVVPWSGALQRCFQVFISYWVLWTVTWLTSDTVFYLTGGYGKENWGSTFCSCFQTKWLVFQKTWVFHTLPWSLEDAPGEFCQLKIFYYGRTVPYHMELGY